MADGSGPKSQPRRHPRGEIPGWVRLPGDGPGETHYRPDPDHPLHPYNDRLRRDPRIREWLDRDDELQAFIRDNQDRYHHAFNQLRAKIVTSPKSRLVTWSLVSAGDKLTGAAFAEVEEASRRLGAPDIDPWVKFYYLLGKLVPKEYASRVISEVEPVTLFVFADGTILMRFTGATPNERAAWEPLIRNAQEALGYRKDRGGRPSRKEDPEATEVAKTAARLHHWLGWTYPEIASFFGWSGRREAVDERTRRAVRAGERLLSDKLGGEWKSSPPPPIAKIADSS